MLNLQASFAALMMQSVVHARNLVDTRLIANSSATATMHLLEIIFWIRIGEKTQAKIAIEYLIFQMHRV